MSSQVHNTLPTDQALTDRPANGLVNILGEVLWHSVTTDASIVEVSRAHCSEIENHIEHFLPSAKSKPIRFLEVAAYAHISGYLLAQQ